MSNHENIANNNNRIYSLAMIRDVPVDGTCLFHAMSLPFQFEGHKLRAFLSDFLLENQEKELHGQKIKDWVYWDKNIKAETYAEELQKGLWGGALEITLFSSILGVPIFVYAPDDENEKCNLITETYPDFSLQKYSADIDYIGLLWVNKSHYMNLIFQ